MIRLAIRNVGAVEHTEPGRNVLGGLRKLITVNRIAGFKFCVCIEECSTPYLPEIFRSNHVQCAETGPKRAYCSQKTNRRKLTLLV